MRKRFAFAYFPVQEMDKIEDEKLCVTDGMIIANLRVYGQVIVMAFSGSKLMVFDESLSHILVF